MTALLGAAASLVVVFGVLAQPLEPIASLVVAIVGAILTLVVAFGLRSADARHEAFLHDDRLRTPIATVEETDPLAIGVDAAAREETKLDTDLPEYLERNADEDLNEALGQALDGSGRWIVVVHGLAKVGKSRTLFEGLLRRNRQGDDIRLIAPKRGDALSPLLERFRLPWLRRLGFGRRQRYVLWLDDLEDFTAEGVGINALQAWRRRAGVVVVATYGGKGSERDFGKKGRRRVSDLSAGILTQARQVGLQATNAEELRNLPASLAAVDQRAIATYGLAAVLVAGPALLVKLESQRHKAGSPRDPVGAAIVYTAINWQRCGRSDPISEELLRELWPDHVWPAEIRDRVPATEEEFEAGLKWALEPVAGTIALLRGADAFQAYDYVRRAVEDDPGAPQPSEATWERALATDDPRQAFAVGSAALAAGRMEEAERALSLADTVGDREVAAPASFNLGVLLSDRGESEEADAAFERAVKLGTSTSEVDRAVEEWAGPDEQQREAIEQQLREEGLLDEGRIVWREDVYREQMEEGNGESAADLGLTLWGRGDHEGAKIAFETAISLGFLPASVELGVLLEKMGDPGGAEAAYEQAMESEIAEGAFNLGVLRKEKGDIRGSEEALRCAARLGHGTAASNLGVLLEERGDLSGAEAAYRQAIEADVPEGALGLASVLEREGRVEEAEAGYRPLAASGDLGAAVQLARLLVERGEKAAAREALRPAAEARGTEEVLLLAVVLEETGDEEGAEEAYREMAGQGIGVAAFYLGRLLHRQGRSEEAEAAFAQCEALEEKARLEEESRDLELPEEEPPSGD